MSAIKSILYTQKTLSNGENPVMLYIYQDKPYKISLGYSCKPKQWDKKNGKFRRSMPNYESKNLILRQQELKANEVIDEFTRQGKLFTIEAFKLKFRGIKNSNTFYKFFEERIQELKSLGKIGNMETYQCALAACKRYRPNDLGFKEVTYNYLVGIETLHFQRNCTAGGIGNYMRTIRAVYYEAIKRGLVDEEYNPFSTIMNKKGYSLAKLKSKKNPKAMSVRELEKFKSFDIDEYPNLADSWRLFMFSFYMFGMNFADMCELTRDNIQNDRIIYIRKKTKKPFSLKLNTFAYRIIEYFASTDNGYLFPILRSGFHETPTQKKDRRKKVSKRVNKHLKRIAKILNIDTSITFYCARHTSATTLKRNGVSTTVISEALGHSNAETTTHYLKSFENEVLDSAMTKL